MSFLLRASFFIFFFFGVLQLLCVYCPMPSNKAKKVILSYRPKKQVKLQTVTAPLALKIEKYIKLNKYKKIQLENILRSAHMDISPERHIAQALAPALLFGVLFVPLTLLIHPLVSAVFLYMSVSMFLTAYKKAEKIAKAKKEAIAMELPHFAGTIAEELKKGRDVLGMIASYSKVCSAQFKVELDITIADMQTGNYQEALRRLMARVNHLGLAQICRGLMSVLDGNDQTVYFQIISQSLEAEQDQQTERYIQTLYHKIKPYSMLLLGCMVMLLLMSAGIYIYQTTINKY